MKILLHQQDRRLAALISRKASIMARMIDGASPLVGSSIRITIALLDNRARDRQHLLLPARQANRPALPQNFSIAGNSAIMRSSRFLSKEPYGRRQPHVLLNRQSAEYAHVLRHIGDAKPGDVGRASSR
jgi:hypothetical protein